MLAWLSKGFLAAAALGWSQCLVIGMLLVQFPWSACWSIKGQDTEPQTAPYVLVCTFHGSHHTFISVWMYVRNVNVRLTLAYVSWLTLAMFASSTNTQQLDKVHAWIYNFIHNSACYFITNFTTDYNLGKKSTVQIANMGDLWKLKVKSWACPNIFGVE